jgi:hypothetical protein
MIYSGRTPAKYDDRRRWVSRARGSELGVQTTIRVRDHLDLDSETHISSILFFSRYGPIGNPGLPARSVANIGTSQPGGVNGVGKGNTPREGGCVLLRTIGVVGAIGGDETCADGRGDEGGVQQYSFRQRDASRILPRPAMQCHSIMLG